MSPRRTPAIGSPIDVFQSQVAELINRDHVFTTAPNLESMEVGETALGNATESLPTAKSHAIYFKPNRDVIVVLSSDGSTIALRFIGAAASVFVSELFNTVQLMEQMNEELKLITFQLARVTGVELELGDVA